jgi:hypothetical protein
MIHFVSREAKTSKKYIQSNQEVSSKWVKRQVKADAGKPLFV